MTSVAEIVQKLMFTECLPFEVHQYKRVNQVGYFHIGPGNKLEGNYYGEMLSLWPEITP